MIKKIAKKIYRTVFPLKEKNPSVNLKKGEMVSVDPSAILMTSKNGEIIFEGNNYIGRQVEIGTEGLIQIASGTTIQDRCILLGDIEIGRFCTFAPNIYLSSGRHYYNYKPNFYLRDQDEMIHSDSVLSKQHSKKIVIEDDVWVGINCVVMSGVKIGRGAVIGSNSVVTKDVAPFSVVVGIPAKEIKKRLDFTPKDFLSCNNDNDLPNFYKGVFVEMKNINEDRKKGGLSASKAFTLYLKEGVKMQLTIKKCASYPLAIIYDKQKVELTDDFAVITFEMQKGNFQHFSFDVNTNDNNEKIALIKEVKVVS